jgi:rubrerythrin
MTDEDVKEAIKTAIQMEKDGYAFYQKAAAQTTSEMGAQIFTSIAQDELVHLETFKKMFADAVGKEEFDALVESGNKYTKLPIFPKDLKSAEGTSADADELDALNIAMGAEKDAIDFYGKIRDKCEDDEFCKIIDKIIDQEKSHYSILQGEFDHLSNTGFWYEIYPHGSEMG